MKKIDDIISDAKTVGITGHLRPDGDCVGSCLGLYNYLVKNRPDLDVRVFLETVEDKFNILENTDKVETKGYDGTVFDVFICLDTASIDRLGINEEYFTNATRTVCIDHHASNKGYADYNWIIGGFSSASEVLYYLLDEDKVDKAVADALYMGIAHDSGVFRFQSTTSDTMRCAAKLIDCGVNVNEILETTYYRKTYNQMMITSKIQSNAVLAANGRLIYGWCTLDMMDEYNVDKSELDAVVASIRNVDGVEVAMFIYQLDDKKCKISLRSRNEVDVSAIAVSFGGGGHVRASGFEIEADIKDAIKMEIGRAHV